MICLAANLHQATVPSFIHHEERGALRLIPSPQHWVSMLAALASQDTSSRSNTLDSVLERQISRQMFPPFTGLPCFLRSLNCSRRTPKNSLTNVLRPRASPAVKHITRCRSVSARVSLPSSARTCSTTSRRMPWRSTALSDPQPSRTLLTLTREPHPAAREGAGYTWHTVRATGQYSLV